MNLFPVYNLFDVEICSGQNVWVFDQHKNKYLDCYGGHAVISVGHSHPYQVRRMKVQLDKLMFYSNSVRNPLQEELAIHLSNLSGLVNYQLFLVNSGAEANENALKLASFITGENRILAFSGGFHGRTSAAVNVTDNPRIQAPINKGFAVDFVNFDDFESLDRLLNQHRYAAIIIEPIQGVAGIYEPSKDFVQKIDEYRKTTNCLLIADEVQSGNGRTGDFFAYQIYGIEPDLVTTAKGLGNGFPIGAVLVHEKYQASYGMLGTTFGGNHLACVAASAVCQIIQKEELMENARNVGTYFSTQLKSLGEVVEVRGRGLMLGAEFGYPIRELRSRLLFEHRVFTGNAANPNTLRFLPPLTFTTDHVDQVITAMNKILSE